MSKKIVVIVFLMFLCFPLLDSVLEIAPKLDLVEKRKMARKPVFRFHSCHKFPGQYGQYYNDHFPFRSRLIYWNNFLKLKLFGVSGVAKVLVGKEGWLFMDKPGHQPGTVEYFRSLRLFSRQELEQWKQVLEERHQWLTQRGIHYVFMIAPNKNTIYPGYMPDHIRKARAYSRMDQLVLFLGEYSNVPVLDLRKALWKAKKKERVYSRTDTHWNAYGAYIAYRELMKFVSRYFEKARPLPLSRFGIETRNWSGGDLAEMLFLHREVLREDTLRLADDAPLKASGGGLPKLNRFVKQGYTEIKTAVLPNILMVHDSFYNKLKPYLSESFSRVLYIWDWDMNFYPHIIERENPRLVIDEMAERFLMSRPPVNPGKIRNSK
jgi:hypothetical protein